ncbi:ferrous iron transport protein B [Sphingobacterium spiritivorum]|uniref:ferrous iron transport protein B n=1 Tax=Sphingobacterium spiritivorum TaxID=258 RepID=UPI003DA3617B
MKSPIIALLGNPNVGKTSLFNKITKLHQKVGNYPGITVEKREGTVSYANQTYRVIDLPGTYTLFPNSLDEEIVFNTLHNKQGSNFPDLVVVVSEPTHLKRSIVLYQQARELGLPAIFVMNMIDEAKTKGIYIDLPKLEQYLQTKVYQTNARTGEGINEVIKQFKSIPGNYFGSLEIDEQFHPALDEAKKLFPLETEYSTWQFLAQNNVDFLSNDKRAALNDIRLRYNLDTAMLQKSESLIRHKGIDEKLQGIISYNHQEKKSATHGIDGILLHPLWGYVIFFSLLFLMFQAIFAWAAPLMDFIDETFASLSAYVQELLPAGPVTGLLTDGIIAGIGGIVIFVPQIAILFLFISLMEETGYMSRVVFLMDRWLRPFGLNGKSVIPLMSGAACAVPAIMSARNIENSKERLITMLVTPFMTCSARLPIYIVIIGLVIPDTKFLGFNIQGITLFALYILGVVSALGSAWLLSKMLKSKHKTFLIFELPTYKLPDWRNVAMNVWEKSSGFIINAGKIILAMSVILWVLGSFGPGKFNRAEEIVNQQYPDATEEELENHIKSFELENSFLGILGTTIEPAIAPLGYDWKMGIGLISSFAAREVFVSTMATVYALGDTEDESTIQGQMRKEINRNTGLPAYNFASGISLLLFYAFAMQCMSTIAIVKKETGSWKLTLLQTGMMTGLAYIAAFIAYQLLK